MNDNHRDTLQVIETTMKRQRREEDEEIASSIQVKHLANGQDNDALQAQIIAAVNEKNYNEAMKLSAEACLLQRAKFKSKIMFVDTAGKTQNDETAAGDEEIKSKEKGACKLNKGEKTAFDRVIASLETGLIATIGTLRQLDLARSYYEIGLDSEVKAAFKLATQKVKRVVTPGVICNRIEKVKTAWKVSAILKLNDDVLLELFSYFDTKDMLSCWQVNRHWSQLLAKLLQQKTLKLKGTVEKIDKEWKRYGEPMQRAGVARLDVYFQGNNFDDYIDRYNGRYINFANTSHKRDHDQNVAFRFTETSLYQAFPKKTLESVSFSSDNIALDVSLWECLRSCQKLKSIEWTYTYDCEEVVSEFWINVPDFKVAGCSLAKCHLDYIDIRASIGFCLEKEFEKLCNAAKFCRIIVEGEEGNTDSE